MSGSLNLNGTVFTTAEDTDYNYFQIDDTSPAKDGSVVMSAGSRIFFDDATGAGFVATADHITVTTNGNASHECEISSINRFPDHRWSLPVTDQPMVCTETVFTNYTGEFPAGFIPNNCRYTTEPYAYCTANEVINLTGTTLSEEVIAEIIGQASNEINARLGSDGISPHSSDPILAAICLNKSIAGVLTRYRLDGTRAGSANVDGIATGDNIGQGISQYEEKAEKLLAAYIKIYLPTDREMTFFQILNRSE